MRIVSDWAGFDMTDVNGDLDAVHVAVVGRVGRLLDLAAGLGDVHLPNRPHELPRLRIEVQLETDADLGV